MSTTATIFKIKAIADFLAKPEESDKLSFRKNQAFYCLSLNNETNCYFVSTQYSTPFARGAVNGLVPATHFVIEDNFGNKLPPNLVPQTKQRTMLPPSRSAASRVPKQIADRIASSQAASYVPMNSFAPLIIAKSNKITSMPLSGNTKSSSFITGASIYSYYIQNNQVVFQLKVNSDVNQSSAMVKRSYDDFKDFHARICQSFPYENSQGLIPNLPINNTSFFMNQELQIRNSSRQILGFVNSLFTSLPKMVVYSDVFQEFFMDITDGKMNEIVAPLALNSSKASKKLQALLGMGMYGRVPTPVKNGNDMDVDCLSDNLTKRVHIQKK